MRYLKKRYYIWSPEIAYSVGLIASDGCLSGDGRHIDLTSIDIEQLQNFSKAIGRNLSIRPKQNSSPRPAYRIGFSDVAYYDFLLGIGLTPAKSKTLSSLKIPDSFYADFIRGVFDGDGCVYSFMDLRWKSSFMFYVNFASASIKFIYYLRSTNQRLINVTSGSVRHNLDGTYILSYAKANSHMLYKYMYYDEKVISLTRKRLKLLTYTQKDLADIQLIK